MKITIVGAGHMGGAIALGLARGAHSAGLEITCTARSEATLERLRVASPRLRTATGNAAAAAGADVVVLAVKPWLMEEVVREIRPSLEPEQTVVSVAAGIPLARLESWLAVGPEGATPAIFRAMPNTAVAVGEGMTFLASLHATDAQRQHIAALFGDLGHVLPVDERQLEAGMVLASCGIAFALRYIRAAAEGGVQLGIRADQAQRIVAQTVKGAAALLEAEGAHAEEEIDKVTTPGGITIRGLNEMERSGFTAAVVNGLLASK